jgi:LmbE family N-acetylglucosaminyl deacetylase
MNVLFIFAHPDDEAYGPAGTIAKFAKGNDVTVLSLCKGDRPGNEQVSAARQEAFEKSCALLGAEPRMLNYSDCQLEYASTLKSIEQVIKEVEPELVFTHNISDLHRDHRTVADACLVACRPTLTSSIRALYMCEMASSTNWTFGQVEPMFTPNFFIDITAYIDSKATAMELYQTELYEFPDARSVVSMKALAMQRGTQVGAAYAEAFRLVFAHDREI